jgi:hypothetical protein
MERTVGKNNITRENPTPWVKKPEPLPEYERPEPLKVVPAPLPLDPAFLDHMRDEGMTVLTATENFEHNRNTPGMSEEEARRLSRGGEYIPFTAPSYPATEHESKDIELDAVVDGLILKSKTQRPLNACPHWPGLKDGTCTGWCGS